MVNPLMSPVLGFFFFNDTATTEIYTALNTLSLHDALPISTDESCAWVDGDSCRGGIKNISVRCTVIADTTRA